MKKLLFLILVVCTTTVISQNVNLSNGLIFDGEPYIAINPNNSNHIVVAWMGYELGNRIQINTKSSTNGGLSWNPTVNIPHVVASYTSADVSLAYGVTGTVFLSFIDFTGQNVSQVEGAVYLVKSINNGQTWSTPVEVIHSNDDPGKKCIDRPWMVIDKSNSASQGTIYITTVNAKAAIPGYNPYISISTDGGNTFGWRYLDTINYLAGTIITQPMASPTVATDGTFYALYPSYMPSQSVFGRGLLASSTNSGNSFNYNEAFTYASGITDTLPKLGSYLTSDLSNPDHLVLTTLEMNNGNIDVFIRESLNKGQSWTQRSKINDDTGMAMQDLVWSAFDTDGDLVVSWRDRRNGSSSGYETDSEIWAAVRKEDSNHFSPNFKLSDTLVPYNSILAESGNDFMSIKYINDTLHAVWGDPRGGFLNIWYQKMTDKGSLVSVTNITDDTPVNISIYPNPTHDFIQVDGENMTEIGLYNSSGQLVNSINLGNNDSNVKIDISQFPNGIYTLFVTTKIGSKAFQIVKN